MKSCVTYIISAIMILLTSCSNNNLYEDMPSEIQSFISQYYPNSSLDSFSSSGSSYTVIIKDGPTLIFDSDCKWIKINGNGSTLPQVLLFNDLPPALYSYLQENEETNSVFTVQRDSEEYEITLLNYTIIYRIDSGEITGRYANPS